MSPSNYQSQRSTDQWMELIIQCRQSGLSDAAWCRQQGIPASSFYNAVSRLRKKACSIPEPSGERPGRIIDLTSGLPDVVPIHIEPEMSPEADEVPVGIHPAAHLDNPHSIEILIGKSCVRISNGTDPALLSAVIAALGRLPC